MNPFDVENLGSIATIWTIRASMFCLFGALLLRLLASRTVESSDSTVSTSMEGAKHLYILGSFFALLHAMAAMIFYHHGSHELAFEDTARQTEALLGIRVGAGIYFNYAFVSIWMVDAMWWISRPIAYQSRSNFLNGLVYGFLLFIAINGTIVFETGPVRWVSIVGLVILAFVFMQKRRKPSLESE